MIEDIADDYLDVIPIYTARNVKIKFKQSKQIAVIFLFVFFLKDSNCHHLVWQVTQYKIS